MQISKFMLVVCAASCAASVSAHADDNPAQAKARAALEQKLQNPNGQTSAPAQASAAAEAPKAAAPEAAPAAQPAAPVQQADSEAIARARAAVRQRIGEMQAQDHGQKAAPAKAVAQSQPTPAPAVQAEAPVAPSAQPVFQPETTPKVKADSEAIVRAREALRAKIAESRAQAKAQPAVAASAPAPVAPAAVQPAVAASSPAPAQPAFDANLRTAPGADPAAIAKAEASVRQKVQQGQAQDTAAASVPAKPVQARTFALNHIAGFKPIVGPELPSFVTPEKQQQLAELLSRYKADKVTPEEYHAERAKILGLPAQP